MSYAVMMEPGAPDDVAQLPPAIRALVEEACRMLAAAPTRLSRPFRAGGTGQLFERAFPIGDMQHYLVMRFQYGADEQTLHVTHVNWEAD